MAIITEDVIQGNGISEDNDGKKLPRIFKVEFDDVKPENQLQVLDLNGIPAIGDRHPYDFRLGVKSKAAVAGMGGSVFTVTCQYAKINADDNGADDDSPAQITVGSTTTNWRTDLDRDDTQMVLKPADGTGSDLVKKLANQTFIADVPRVLGVASFTRREVSQPAARALEYSNKLNSAEFLGQPAGQVYCDSITGSSSDGGSTYNVTYSFTIDPKGWQARAVYLVDNEPVNTPAPSVANKTEAFFDVLDEIDFNDLNLQ